MKHTNSELLFPDVDTPVATEDNLPEENHTIHEKWKVMVVDDEPVVHDVTLLVLQDFTFKGRKIEIIQGYSGAQCRDLIGQHPDTAVILLDVVMETDTAGLDTVKYIRDELHNTKTRIILRTGQPGQAPEREVITHLDINDYKEKTELTSQKLFTCITTALRAYDDISAIEKLAYQNSTLENRVHERTMEILKINEELKGEVVEKNKAYEQLKKSENRLHHAQQIAKIGNWEWDIRQEKFICSEQIYNITGMSRNINIKNLTDFLKAIQTSNLDEIEKTFNSSIEQCANIDIEHKISHPDGSYRQVYQQGYVETDKNGHPLRIVATLQDITTRFLIEAEMKKLSSAVEQIADSVMITDVNGIIEYINPAFEKMTGYSKNEIIGKTPRMIKSGKQTPAFYKKLWSLISSGTVFVDVIVNRKKDGSYYYEEKTITPQIDEYGNIINYISTGKDVTERIESQEKLIHLAHHDSLTGLPNRLLFHERLSQTVARRGWCKAGAGVMFIDLDRFKIINDTLGHDAGDELLLQIAQRLLSCIREGDTVARMGGDEFAVILTDLASENDIPCIAEKMLAEISRPIHIKDHEIFVTPSIGISFFPQDSDEPSELLKKADSAMYRSKEKGKNTYHIYSHDVGSDDQQRLLMETGLRYALENNELSIVYQPQISTIHEDIIGVEALVRWHNPELGTISPDRFIPVLEETGLIHEVGQWILYTACKQLVEWNSENLIIPKVAVNLSIRQIQDSNFYDKILSILDKTGLPPNMLELEITEGLLITQIDKTARLLHQLHSLGISLSIDDFGTGYSSMSYLKTLPFNTLKIDRIFVRDINFNSDDAAISTAIISLAHNLGMDVVAEGVETPAQLDYLKSHGCDSIQGFLYSPPLTPDNLLRFVSDINS